MQALRMGRPWATRALLVAAAVELFFVGQMLHPAPTRTTVGGSIRAGALRLSYGPDWLEAAPLAGLKGWSGLAATDGTRVSIGELAPGSDALQAVFGRALPIPARVRIGSAPALAYRGGGTVAYVLTTGDGTRAGVVCANAAARDVCG